MSILIKLNQLDNFRKIFGVRHFCKKSNKALILVRCEKISKSWDQLFNFSNWRKYPLVVGILFSLFSNPDQAQIKEKSAIDHSFENPYYKLPQKNDDGVLYLVDTAVVFGETNTMRYCYSYTPGGRRITQLWQERLGDSWENVERNSYSYDANDIVLSWLYESWANGQWNYSKRQSYVYNLEGKLVNFLGEFWRSGEWVNTSRSSYVYDEYGNLLTILSEHQTDGVWVPSFRVTNKYDNKKNLLCDTHEQWLYERWWNVYRNTYTYDLNDKKLTQMREDWRNDLWVIGERATFSYLNGKVLNLLSEYWLDEQWKNNYQYNMTFNVKGNLLSEVMQTWNTTKWVNERLYSYTYDNYNNNVTYLYAKWYDEQWANEYQFTYLYDADRNPISCYYQGWGYNGSETNFDFVDSIGNKMSFIGKQVDLHYKKIVTAVTSEKDITPGTYELSQNYPNPFNPTTNIDYALPTDGKVTLKIYDMLGCEVKTLVDEYQKSGKYTTSFDAGKLSSGIYVYKLVLGSYSAQRKMLFLK
ncbi:MAG: T9SS type A sorting domain-containing protein [Ignavibacteriaceae bacterium]